MKKVRGVNFSSLNDDILVYILTYNFYFNEYLKLELVCKRWRSIILTSCYRKYVTLIISPAKTFVSDRLSCTVSTDANNANRGEFVDENLLPKFLRFVKRLSITIFKEDHWNDILDWAPQLSSIETLELYIREPSNVNLWSKWFTNFNMLVCLSKGTLKKIKLEVTLLSLIIPMEFTENFLTPIAQKQQVTEIKLINGLVLTHPLKIDFNLIKCLFVALFIKELKFREFDFIFDDNNSENIENVVCCPSLEILRFSCCSARGVKIVLLKLHSPRLKYVEFYNIIMNENIKQEIWSLLVDKKKYPEMVIIDFE